MLCKSVLLDLLRSEGPSILAEPLAIPKFAKIYILLIKLDNLNSNGGQFTRQWPEAISDLVTLPQCTSDIEHQKTFIGFIVSVLLMFDEEIVDKSLSTEKSQEEL